ncbi:MAG TPA: isocitrate lyase/PEP mutase family protein [Nitrolancea sp.]|jgi:carboxyvinyl-carboxyphosphonate phosphorylmutase|nr:isocitrate lyase/PEP mutase family protein [Nitrolancea sp.]
MASLLNGHNLGPSGLRSLLAHPPAIVAPGAYDALSARLIEEAGFPAVYMTGFGVAASLLGRPDVGLTTLSEMVESVRRIVQAVRIPVIADADTGYGNAHNVVRTVREYEMAGVAGIQLEDQVFPKRCGHMNNKQVVPAEEMIGKIEAAVAARQSPDLVIIARTDARAVEGLESAIQRARRYHAAGADMLFVEAPQSEAEIETVARELAGIPLFFNWAEGGKTPPVALERLHTLGYRIVIFPVGSLLASTAAVRAHLQTLRRDGTPQAAMDQVTPFPEFLDFIGLPEIDRIDDQYGGTRESE